MGQRNDWRARQAAVAARERRPDPPPSDGHRPAETDEEPKPLGQEAPEIIEDASQIGERRLDRSIIGDAVTSFIGGMSICFGVIAMAWAGASVGNEASPSIGHLVAALAYPVGFVILLIGKSELFTENFLLPVTGVIEGHGSIRQLLSLWGVSLVFNLIGVFVFAFLVSRPGLLPAGPAERVIDLADHVVHYPFWTAFVKALFAGWLMTILTWLLLAAEGMGPRLLIMWLIGTLLVLAEFTHVIISAAEVFMALLLGAPITATDWLGQVFVPVLIGNLVGGVVFVTLLQWVQAQYARR